MVAKFLMQDVGRVGIDWGEVLPPYIFAMWKPGLENPRCFRKLITPINCELHVFTEASEDEFGSCIYLHAEYSQGNFALNLLIAKAHVAPSTFYSTISAARSCSQ